MLSGGEEISSAVPAALRALPRPDVPDGPYLVAGLGQSGCSAALALSGRVSSHVRAWGAAHMRPPDETIDLLRSRGVDVRLGGDPLAALRDPDARCVVKSPGIPDEDHLIASVLSGGPELLDEAELGWRLDGRPTIGVTGTNGKSTVCSLIVGILEGAGLPAALGGNAELAPALSLLAERSGAARVVVAELSSFQLRHSPALLPEVAVITNLSRDSWHRHGGPEGYASDKRRIALRGERAASVAVVNADDPFAEDVGAQVEARGGRAVRFGSAAGVDVRVTHSSWTLDSGRLELEVGGRALPLHTKLPGHHNAQNAAAAIGVALALDLDVEAAARGIERAEGVPGRLERVAGEPAVFVDYAHNPDGIRRVLATARAATRGRLIVAISAMPVFDEGQYRAMAAEVARGADVVVPTTERIRPDAPMEEPPAFFAALRDAGVRAEAVVDRRRAIAIALGQAGPEDVVLILGRGMRRTPVYDEDGAAHRADDREAAREALRARGR